MLKHYRPSGLFADLCSSSGVGTLFGAQDFQPDWAKWAKCITKL